MIRRPPRSTLSSSSAASDVYKRQQPCRCLDTVKNAFFGTDNLSCTISSSTYSYATRQRGSCATAHYLLSCKQQCLLVRLRVSHQWVHTYCGHTAIYTILENFAPLLCLEGTKSYVAIRLTTTMSSVYQIKMTGRASSHEFHTTSSVIPTDLGYKESAVRVPVSLTRLLTRS